MSTDLTLVQTIRVMSESEQIEKAIEVLEAQRSLLGDEVVDAAIMPMREKLAALKAEGAKSEARRKLVTILFTDITGSTHMSQHLDPEDILAFMDGAMVRFNRIIEEHNGHVFRFMGDGLIAIFGDQVAREDDAQRAILAGLALIEESKRYAIELEEAQGLEGFNIRVGINSGTIVLGGGVEDDKTAMGMAINLAARMESTAPPGRVRISHATYSLARGLFDVEEQPPLQVKGKDEPLITYLVKGVNSDIFHAASRGVEGAGSPMIGRDEELSLLQATFLDVEHNSQAHLSIISGDPGIGKTRLLFEFERWPKPTTREIYHFHGRANQQLENTPFGLFRAIFADFLDIFESDVGATVRLKLEAGLSPWFEEDAILKSHYIGALLGFDLLDSPYLAGIKNDPRQLYDQALFYLARFFAKLAGENMILLYLDDLHWADGASLDALQFLLQECRQTRFCAVATARPALFDRRTQWATQKAASDFPLTMIELHPLDKDICQHLIEVILHRVQEIPQRLRDAIVESSEGNPYYAEELVNVLIDDGIIIRQDEERWQVNPSLYHSLRIPSTLTAVLQARLDNLNPDEKNSLQRAAVVGRTFWDATLRDLGEPPQMIRSTLDSLGDRHLIEPHRQSIFEGTAEFSFRHGLLRDVTYETVLRKTRQLYHRRVASWLLEATSSSGRLDEFAGLVAEHLDLAGDSDAAADWFLKAGAKAYQQGAFSEARQFYDRALSTLDPADRHRRWQASYARHDVSTILGEIDACRVDTETLLAIAHEFGDDEHYAQAYFRRASDLSNLGEEQEALPYYEKALHHAREFGDNSLVSVILASLLVCQTRLNHFDQASLLAQEVLERVGDLGANELAARLLTNAGLHYSEIGDIGKATQLNYQQVSLCQQLNNRLGEVIGLSNLGLNLCNLGQFRESHAHLLRAIDLADEIGARRYGAFARLNLGFAYWRTDELARAGEILATSSHLLLKVGDRFGEAAGHFYAALVLEAAENYDGAIQHCQRAYELYDDLGALGYLADVKSGLARAQFARGCYEVARQEADLLWRYLQDHGSQGMELPILAYLTCYNVFQHDGDESGAREVILLGYEDLTYRAEKISDRSWRDSYRHQVPENQRIAEMWQSYSD